MVVLGVERWRRGLLGYKKQKREKTKIFPVDGADT
jgi:hypothetical protein